jgi:hypothetical protein
MTDPSELIPSNPVTLEEIAAVMTELEQYQARLVNDTLAVAERIKIMEIQAHDL